MSFNPVISAGTLAATYTGTPGSLTGFPTASKIGLARYKLVVSTAAWWAQGIADTPVIGLASNDTFAATAHGLTTGMPVQVSALGDTAVSKAWQVSNGGVFTDVTATLNDATANNTTPFATGIAGDYFAVGYTNNFGPAKFNVGTVGTVGTLTWEYWNGTAWTALTGVTDNTTGFTVSGSHTVVFTIPADWAKTSLNGETTSYYYIRARCTAPYTVNPLLTQGWVDGTLPGGLSAATTYYAIVTDANHFKVATTRANALAGTAIDLTTVSAGTTATTVAVASTTGSAYLPAGTLVDIDGSLGAKISVVQDTAGGTASLMPSLGG